MSNDTILLLSFFGGIILTPIILFIHAKYFDGYYTEDKNNIGFDDISAMCLIGLFWFIYWPIVIILSPFVNQSK
jgi:hypothetical protein